MRLSLRLRRKKDTGAEESSFWFVRHSKPMIFLILTLGIMGCYLAFTVPIAVFPATDFPRVVIGVDNGVMPIDQMMVTITRPVEEAVNSVPGLVDVRSITSRGSAEISLYFDWQVDMFQTLQLVDSALSRVRSLVPATAQIESNRLTFASFPIMGYSLTSDRVSQTRLWEMATYELKPRLNRLQGVATVVIQGGQEPEFQITPDPAKLLVTHTTPQDILEGVRKTNLIESPGLLARNHMLFLGLVDGQVRSPEEIANIVLKTTPTGVPVRVGDVADVHAAVKPVYTVVTANAKPAVLLNISRQPTSSTMVVADEVHAEIESMRKALPPGVELQPFYDQSLIVGASIASVRDAIIIGLILASIIMVLFLRDWGTSVVAGLVIPITMAITFIVLKIAGQSFNLMTLGGLAAAVGLVIDNAIVVVENIVLHRDAGQNRFAAIQSALKEITVPLIGSTVTPVVVFLPLVFITGVTATFFRALAITVGAALFTSLLLAVTWTPNLSQYFIRDKNSKGSREAEQESSISEEQLLAAEETDLNRRFGRVLDFYELWLRRALQHRKLLAALSAVLIVTSYVCYRVSGSDLLPAMDEGGFVLDYHTPAGSSLEETNRIVGHMERILAEVPEVESTSRRTGLQLGLFPVTEANRGDILIKLKTKRSRSSDDIISEVRAKVAAQEPAAEVEFVQVLQDMIGDLISAPEPIEIKLFGQDPALLAKWAPQVADTIKKLPGVVDVMDGVENTVSGPAVTFHVNPTVAARAGFAPEEVVTDATAILEGEPAPTPVVAKDRAYTIRLRFPEEHRASLEAMGNTLLTSSTGSRATLGSLATITEVGGQDEIRRENLQRVVAVTARLEGVDMGTGVSAVQKAVANMKLPSSIRVVYGGTYQEQQKSFGSLLAVLVLAVVLVFISLLFEFRTFTAPVAILASALLSTSGVFVALAITGTTFNISSFMGLIMVVGIVAKNGILLLDADQRFRRLGYDPEKALLQAGRRRLRPIVMTALATIAGMLPLAIAWGSGSQMLQPLAIAVIGGTLISMVLSLIITPAVHFYLSGTELEWSVDRGAKAKAMGA